MIKKLISLTFFFVLLSSNAKVWHATNEWNMQWEEHFSQWMKTNQVHKEIFTDRNSPYFGIKADCADATYALRAIFSKQNSLPFQIKNPTGSRGGYGYLTNDTNYFDYAGNEDKRVVALINYVGQMVGTEQLSYHDTLPVKISKIDAGMMFTYKIKRPFGKFIRHSYNIKDVTPAGDFDVIYATQAIAKNGLPLNLKRNFSFSNAPQSVWGFKRFKWPSYFASSPLDYPSEYGYSQEQFSLVKELGAREFFRSVKKTLQISEQSPEEVLKSRFGTLCQAAVSRIEYVNQGLAHMAQTGRCMNYADYDAFSTPARDASLKKDFENLFYEMSVIENEGNVGEVDYLFWDQLLDIRNGRVSSSNESELLTACNINYREGVSIHLAELYRRIRDGLLSSHPNDGMAQRWGETTQNRTRCRAWY